jgi:hypothetical protein
VRKKFTDVLEERTTSICRIEEEAKQENNKRRPRSRLIVSFLLAFSLSGFFFDLED